MKPSIEQLGTLLAARRVDRPEEGYWQDFLCEFHRRQRQEVVPESGLMGVWQRVSGFVSELGTGRWAYGAGIAYATLTVAFLVIPAKVTKERPVGVPVSHQVVPSTQPAKSAQPVTPPTTKRPEAKNPVGDPVF